MTIRSPFLLAFIYARAGKKKAAVFCQMFAAAKIALVSRPQRVLIDLGRGASGLRPKMSFRFNISIPIAPENQISIHPK